jgi:hypothetical protein
MERGRVEESCNGEDDRGDPSGRLACRRTAAAPLVASALDRLATRGGSVRSTPKELYPPGAARSEARAPW